MKKYTGEYTVALAGNPNVGKSTLFNALTGLRQHTGNWAGKTVESAVGSYIYEGDRYLLIDLPGMYSMQSDGAEERIARDSVASGEADVTVVVADATKLESGLRLALETAAFTDRLVFCVNLTDDADKKGIRIDYAGLESRLKAKVVQLSAGRRRGLDALKAAVREIAVKGAPGTAAGTANGGTDTVKTAEEIYSLCVSVPEDCRRAEGRIDRLLASPLFGVPVMLLLLGLIFWITIEGANRPSQLLMDLFSFLEEKLAALFDLWGAPSWLKGMAVEGCFRTTGWVVSVMLPPMAIFFPLFSLLEDAGFLPRIAFNTDRCFAACGSCGKQALTMCMGVGCNACGVTGCRIIESENARTCAALTNGFIPCNGRYPILIALISMFLASSAAVSSLFLVGFVLIAAAASLLCTRLLAKTLYPPADGAFVLELPPYRMPRVGTVIFRSLVERTAIILSRAVCVAAPAGVVIWLLANAGGGAAVSAAVGVLDPVGRFFGLDGVIFLAFLLALPANELIMPLMLMLYSGLTSLTDLSSLDSFRLLLTENGWDTATAVSVCLLVLFHSPCATTLLTVKKETGSTAKMLLSALLPSAFGLCACLAVRLISGG